MSERSGAAGGVFGREVGRGRWSRRFVRWSRRAGDAAPAGGAEPRRLPSSERRWSSTLIEPTRCLAALAVFTVGSALTGCGGAREEVRRPPVVIVTIDTLRSDRLPAYGYRGVATPALDSLRRDAILFERAYTHAPLTLPAHASLFTGRLPTEHGVRDNAGYRLDAGEATLAALLARAGYATGAAVSAYVVRGETGLDAGFGHYDDAIDLGGGASLAEQQRAGADTLRASLPWLREAAAAGPFFYWLHLYEPHTPYTPPEPYRSRAATPYEGEIAAADAVLGELMALLRELDVYNDALVVVTSDHGEGLGDHGEQEHGVLLYREALQVPLLVKLPRNERAGESVARPVQLVDVLPTVLEVTRVEAAPASGAAPLPPGRSLVGPAAESGRPEQEARTRRIYAETYYPRLHHGWSELRSIVAGDYHYVDGPDPELYDLAADLEERRNLAQVERNVATALARAVAEIGVEPAAAMEEDAETRRRLEALGYLSGPARPSVASTGERPDPKTQLAALAALESARARFGEGDFTGAERELRRLVAAQPAMVDAWETLGDVLESAGDLEPALEARRRAVAVSGGAAEQALKIAPLLLRLGRVEDAAEHARLAVDAFPETAHVVLARIAMGAGDYDEAEREARAAVLERAGTVTPVLTLAEVLAAKGDAEGALEVIASVEEELLGRALPDPRPFLLRAEILLARGRTGEAGTALELAAREASRLLAAHPASPVGHAALARVHELRGEEGESIAALERALDRGALDDAMKPKLAIEWSRQGRTEEAAALVEPSARRGDPAALHAWAIVLTGGGDHAAARQALDTLLARAPDRPDVLETAGLVDLRLGRARSAAASLERAVELAPGGANAWNLLGVARWEGSRDAAGAITAWEKALALDPERWEVLQNLAQVALENGRRELARDALTRFVAQAPPDRFAAELAEARELLARLAD